MVNNLKELLEKVFGKEDEPISHIDGDALIIECDRCEFMPEPGSRECFRCMVEEMSSTGSADRIIMRTGVDVEISGRSGGIVRSIANLHRWSSPLTEPEKKCKRCDKQRDLVMAELWKSFPDMRYDCAYETLNPNGCDVDCSMCIRSTLKVVQQIESDMNAIKARMIG